MSKPLEGIRFAATFVDEQTESDLISKVRSLGGVFHHKMDNEVRFLVVGKRYTKKYDFALTHQITLISSEAFFSVYVHWRSGEELNFLNDLTDRKLKPFEGELVCLSNMESRQKDGFHELIAAGGGQYSIAFARVNTILVSPQGIGRKIDGAKKWGTPVVHPKWISDSMKFGAALNPERYNIEDPNAIMEPPNVIANVSSNGESVAAGPDATTTEEHAAPVLKRRRGGELLFNAPLAKRDRTSVGSSMASFTGPPLLSSGNRLASSASKANGIFQGIRFHFDGFDSRQLGILNRAVKSLAGNIDSENNEYLVVHSGAPNKNPNHDSAKVITEWAIERSIYQKRNALDDIWSQPVLKQPADGFTGLSLCITGFQGIEQRHATLLSKMLGATFLDTLKEDRDLLVAASDKAHKVPYAISWQIPVVNIDWLWQSALAGKALPLANEYVLDGKGPRPPPRSVPQRPENQPGRNSVTSENQDDPLYEINENNVDSFDGGNIRYQDDDAEARAEVLMALGEKPSSIPEPEPAAAPAVPVKQTNQRRRYQK